MPSMPFLPLFPYQIDWSADRSRFKIYLKSRQIGISFAEIQDIVEYQLTHKTPWYYLSISEDRAAEAIEYAEKFCRSLGVAVTRERGEMDFEGISYKHCTVTFPAGNRLIGLPANPRTARGASGNLTLDEFAWHHQATEIWTAVTAYQVWGYEIHVVSTANGQQGEYYRIWTNGGELHPDEIEAALRDGRQPIDDAWSRHLTDIFQAKDVGHPVDLDLCR